jgi:hypothetical protein
MSELFPNIVDFIRVRERCFFCGAKLRCRLSNFIGIRESGMPLLNSPLEEGKFIFDISRTSPSYTVEAVGTLDIHNNKLFFDMKGLEYQTLTTDNMVAKETFIDLRPHIQLYCPKRKCPYQYTVASNIFRAGQIEGGWLVFPFKLYYESFVSGKLWVQNDYVSSRTNIFSIMNEEAEPIVVPLLDFNAMGKDKLLTRIKTLVVFS